MESLPDEVLKKIAAYLRPRDLLACSAVCKKWREKFNTVNIWTPRLLFFKVHYNIQAKYKDMILCPPYFTTLEPLSTARESYIRDQCLRFNWRAGLFTTESFQPKTDGKVFQIINHLDKDGNYWLFMTTAHFIEVWNITNKPYFQSYALKKLPVNLDSLYVLETKVFLIFNNFVQVFSFEHPKYELILQCCFFIDHESPPVDIQGQLKPNFSQPHAKHILVGNFLIGYPGVIPRSVLPAACLHVWNLDILVKLDTVKIISEPMSHCFEDEEEIDSKNLIAFQLYKGDEKKLLLVSNEVTGATVTIFDLEDLRFLEGFFKNYNKIQIVWSTIVDQSICLVGILQKASFFATVTDFHGNDGVIKNLTKLAGIDYASHFFMSDTGVNVKTSNELWFVGVKSGRWTIIKIFDNFETNKIVRVSTVGRFMFTQCEEGPTKMWDLDHRWQIRDLPNSIGRVDISKITCLPKLDFPPKIIFLNPEGNLASVLSFW